MLSRANRGCSEQFHPTTFQDLDQALLPTGYISFFQYTRARRYHKQTLSMVVTLESTQTDPHYLGPHYGVTAR